MNQSYITAENQLNLARTVVQNDLESFAKILEKVQTDLTEIIRFIQYDICRLDRKEFLTYLINHDYDSHIDYKEMFYQSIWFGAVNVVKMLINIGKGSAIDDPKIITQALLSGSIEMVKFCLESGWPITAESLVYIANSSKPEKIDIISTLKLFLEYGVDLNLEYDGKICIASSKKFATYSPTTVLDIAIINANLQLFHFLLQNEIVIKERHLKLAVEDWEIFHVLITQSNWPIETLETVLTEAIINLEAPIQVLEYILENYYFDLSLLKEKIKLQSESNLDKIKILENFIVKD